MLLDENNTNDSPQPPPQQQRKQRFQKLLKSNIPPCVIFTFATLLAISLAALSVHSVKQDTDNSFSKAIRNINLRLTESSLNAKLDLANLADHFLECSCDNASRVAITRGRFEEVSSVLFGDENGVLLYGFVSRVPAADRLWWELDVLDDYPDASPNQIWWSELNRTIPTTFSNNDNNTHFPITYLSAAPHTNHTNLLLRDLTNSPEILEALETATETNQPSLTTPFFLEDEWVIALFHPLFRNASTPAAGGGMFENEELSGFVLSVHDAHALLYNSLRVVLEASSEVFVSVSDTGSEANISITRNRTFVGSVGNSAILEDNHEFDAIPSQHSRATREHSVVVVFGFRKWEVLVVEIEPLLSAQLAAHPWVVFAVVMVVAAFTGGGIKAWSAHTERVETAFEITIQTLHNFVASATHDIRTPTNVFELSLQLLLKTKLTSDQLLLVQDAFVARHFLQQVVDNVVTLERIYGSGESSLEPSLEEVDMRELVDGVAWMLRCHSKGGASTIAPTGRPVDNNGKFSKNVDLVCSYHLFTTSAAGPPDPDRPLALQSSRRNSVSNDKRIVVMSDPKWLQQIVTNFGTNALKFTREGEVEVVVALFGKTGPYGIEESGDCYLRIEVRDTGKGVPPEKQSLLFKRFSQLQNDAGGMGLGLFSVNMLTRALGGRCGVGERTDGQNGAVFWSQFPVRSVKPVLVSKGSPVTTTTHTLRFQTPRAGEMVVDPIDEEPAFPRTQEKRKLCVLIADDVPMNLRLLSRFLSKMGHVVIATSDGDELVEEFEKETRRRLTNAPVKDHPRIDLIVTDVQMPTMNGYEATARIRELEKLLLTKNLKVELRKMPVVGFTASQSSEVSKRCLECGMDAILFKPFRQEKFEVVLGELGLLFDN